MGKAISLAGRTFNRLTPIKQAGVTSHRSILWECRCVCGNTKIATGESIRKGKTKSCGCLMREINRARHLLTPYRSTYNLLSTAARRPGACGISITYAQFLKFVEHTQCHYCTAPIKWFAEGRNKAGIGRGNGGSSYNLDRKDSRLGYTVNNCVVCCARCNRGKCHLFSYDEWRAMTACFRKVYYEQTNGGTDDRSIGGLPEVAGIPSGIHNSVVAEGQNGDSDGSGSTT